MSEEDNPLTRAMAEIEANGTPAAHTARRIRAQIARENGIPKGKVTAVEIAEVANMEKAANREAKLKAKPLPLPVDGVLDVGWVVIVEDKLEFGHTLITTRHYSSPEFAARAAFERWDFFPRTRWTNPEEIEAALKQFVETGMLNDGAEGEYRLRLVPVSLVVREET